MRESIKLSIIVTIYNVERYVRECLDSIFNQDLNKDDYEVIIVNDGTEDNSINVITDLISSHDNVTIIDQENSGSSVAWNNGIANAKGEYILIVDADDLLIEGRLIPLLETALETKADIVIADYVELDEEDFTPSKISTLTTGNTAFSYQIMTGKEMFLYEHHPSQCYVWRKLYKKQFLLDNHISFVPGIHFQDIPFTSECYILAEKCVKASYLLYIYRLKNYRKYHDFDVEKCHENAIAIAKTWDLISRYHLIGEIRAKIEDNIYVNFINFSRRVSHLIIDYKEREGVFDHLRQMVPNFSLRNSIKQKIVTYLFCYYPHCFNNMRFFYVRIIEDKILSLYRRAYFKFFR